MSNLMGGHLIMLLLLALMVEQPVNTAFGVTAFPTVVLIGPDNKLIEQDIFPIGSVSVLEGTFPTGFAPTK
jgi:hypothetical protein